MKKTRIALLVPFILLVLLSGALVGCSKRTIERVEIKKNSFADTYKVDETLGFAGAYALVTYSSGDKEEIPVTPDMVEGFDTATTGNKTLFVTYKEVRSTPFSYRVYNPESAEREILTAARLVLFADPGNGFIDYTVRLNAAELAVTALSFTLSSEQTLGIDADLGNMTAVSDSWSATYAARISSDGTKLKTVVFYEDGRTFDDGSVVIRLRVNGGENRSVHLTNITVSDGEKDYYLPMA